MSAASSTDRNLLFGILAVQTDFISESDLIAAMNAWLLNKQRPLDEYLVESGALDPATHSVIDALVSKHVEKHTGDTARSLEALHATASLRENLAVYKDHDVQMSLGHLAQSPAKADTHATAVPQQQILGEDLRYAVLRPHAAGGLGQVSVARDAELNREVALKELLDLHADDQNSRSRFLQEAEITGGLEHPGVVPIYGLGQYADGRPYYAMRFIRGDSLRQWIERFHEQSSKVWTQATDQLQLRRLLARLIDVCNAIEYAHSRGVLHRDIKPSNIMLGQYGETLVVDWGLAKAMGSAATDATTQDLLSPTLPEKVLQPQSGSGSAPTQMGSAIGTPAFMSPEQAAGRLDELGPASDVFSLGATLYMLLTGRTPQEGKDIGEILMRVQRGMFSKPRELNSAIPRGLEAICLKAMQLSPEDRFKTARQMGEDLEAWLADEPLVALPESIFTRGRRWVKKHRTLVTSGVATLIVALGVSSGGVYMLSQANERERTAKESAVAAKQEVDRQSQRVDKLLTLSKKSLNSYEQLSQAEELNSFPMRDLRGQLQESAIEYYQALSQVAAESESERADRAEAYFRLAETYYEMGDIDQAAESYSAAAERYQELAAEFPENLEYQYHRVAAKVDKADMLIFSQRGPEAKQLLAEGLEQLQFLVDKQPSEGKYQRSYAYALGSEAERLRSVGKLSEASQRLTAATQVLRRYRENELADENALEAKYLLGSILLQHAALESNGQWKFDASLDKFAEAEKLLTELYESDEYFADGGYALASVKQQQGEVLFHRGRGNDAVDRVIEGREVILDVDSYYPDVPDYYRLYIDLQILFGELKVGVPRKAARQLGLEAVEEGIDLTETLLEEMDSQPDDVLRMAMLQKTAGQLNAVLEEQQPAEQHFARALEFLSQFDQSQAEESVAQPSIDLIYVKGEVLYSIGEAYTDSHQTDQAMILLDKSEKEFQQLLQRAPGLGLAYHQIGMILIERAQCYLDKLHYADAIQQFDKVTTQAEKISEIPDSQEMADGYQILANTAKAARLIAIQGIWKSFENLLNQRRYEEVFEQASKYVAYNRRPAIKYQSATTLAQSVLRIQADLKLAPKKLADLEAQHANQSVTWLEELFEQGYIRKKQSRVGALISSKPTLADLREGEAFQGLQQNKRFQKLLKRIETEK